MRWAWLLSICVFAGSAEPALSAPWNTIRVPVQYKTWSLDYATGDKTTISQSYFPFTLVRPIASRGHLVLSTRGASSKVEHAGTLPAQSNGNSFFALSDLKVQGVYRLSNSFLVQGGVSLPAGKTELTLEEFFVVQRVSHPLFGFPLRQYGQGWDFSGGLVWAAKLSDTLEGGIGVGAIYHGEYQLLKDVFDTYRPGYEIAVSGGITTGTDKPRVFNLDLTYRLFGEDEVEGLTAYKQGGQLEVDSRYRTTLGSLWFTRLGGRGVFKAESEIPLEDTLETLLTAPGNSIMGDLVLGRTISSTASLGLTVDLRSYDGSETSRQDGSVYAVGPVLTIDSRRAGYWEISPQYLTGTLNANDTSDAADLSGWAINITYQWQKR